MIVGVFSLSGKETPLSDVGWNSGFSCSGTSMGFTVIFLLVGSSTACISSHLFVVVVEIVVGVNVLPVDAAVIVEPIVEVVELPVYPTEVVDSAAAVGVPPVDRPVVADSVVEACVLGIDPIVVVETELC